MKTGIENIVNKSDLSKQVEDITNCEIERFDKEEAKSTFDTSDISACIRRLIYTAKKKGKDPQAIDKFHNKFTIEKWSNLLGYYVRGKNIGLADCNYNLIGNGDILIEVDFSKILLKVQSVCNKDFDHVLTKGAFKKHVLELMTNEWLAEVNEGLLIYENRDNYKFEIFQVHLFPHILEPIKRKAQELTEYKMKGELPNRPYQRKDAKECNCCSYQLECWAEK